MLKAHNLHKTYKDGVKSIRVLKGIDIEIAKGDFVSIVGPSGAGKSTLLHILGGLDRPTEGRVSFEEVDLNKIDDQKLSLIRNERFGFVFQFYHLLAEFNVLENVMLPGFILKINKAAVRNIKNRAQELLGNMGLGQRLGHFPSQLSGGEQQRTAIARALINNPSVIFCDEPTGNLDSETGDYITGILQGLNKKHKTTVIVVTHNEKLAQIGNRVMHLRDGIITSQ